VAAHNTIKSLAESLRRLAGDYQALQARYALVKKVADVATGNNEQRMSFQRYVLATLLEEVLVATTLRLRVMSRGRYEIRRKLQAADLRSAAGLDLEVFDQYTGMTRAVTTLSGGESFLASLALALGLSDVVQSYAGGIRLDAIFVDEGFGTLDPEALDFAVRALKDLQQAGRLVGIISHVAELREWIDARLELKAGQAGSVAEFVV
jgi:exonuclease SbcC